MPCRLKALRSRSRHRRRQPEGALCFHGSDEPWRRPRPAVQQSADHGHSAREGVSVHHVLLEADGYRCGERRESRLRWRAVRGLLVAAGAWGRCFSVPDTPNRSGVRAKQNQEGGEQAATGCNMSQRQNIIALPRRAAAPAGGRGLAGSRPGGRAHLGLNSPDVGSALCSGRKGMTGVRRCAFRRQAQQRREGEQGADTPSQQGNTAIQGAILPARSAAAARRTRKSSYTTRIIRSCSSQQRQQRRQSQLA